MRNLQLALLPVLLMACRTPEPPIAGTAPTDMTKAADMASTASSPYDGTYDCKRDLYRDISCSPMFFADNYQIRVTGNRVEFVGHGMCQGQWQGAHFSCPVKQLDPTCTYDFALFEIDAALDGGAAGTIAAGIPSDLASSGFCTKR
jgi:hypothetical protein